jgi:hypothetical protein
MERKTLRTIVWVLVFAIAMAFLETAVVVYLRKLYYPDGFIFPLKLIDPDIALTEFLREIATLVMLAGIGVMAGRRNMERFAYFIFAFAIWDIFYYVFLYLLLGWPSSLMTWDVLFLVPVTWVGPVLAPVINSLMMILLAMLIIYLGEGGKKLRTGALSWSLLIIGSLVVLASYTEEYIAYMTGRFQFIDLIGTSSNSDVIAYACSFIPAHFKWWLFAIGAGMHGSAILIIYLKNRPTANNTNQQPVQNTDR